MLDSIEYNLEQAFAHTDKAVEEIKEVRKS